MNAQTQERVNWPTVPVVARAYMDQLERSDAIAAEQLQLLGSALNRAENELSNNSSSEEELTDDLEELSELMQDQGNSRSGKTRDRYLLLAETLEGIADRLR